MPDISTEPQEGCIWIGGRDVVGSTGWKAVRLPDNGTIPVGAMECNRVQSNTLKVVDVFVEKRV